LRKPNEALNVVAISVDSPALSREFAEKIAADGKGKVDYRILSDPGHRVIDAYGIRDPDYNGQKFEGIPRPTVYVIDRSGRVTWTKVELNYRERPTNEDIRAALNGLATSAKVADQYYIARNSTAAKDQLLTIFCPVE
jgi:peroxiredoxin